MPTKRPFKKIGNLKTQPNWIFGDLGTGCIRFAYSNRGDKHCREIGNYPAAQAGTPSLVPQAPSNIVYNQPTRNEPAKPVSFGYSTPLKNQRLVSGVKTALLPSGSYSFTHSLLVDATCSLKLSSIQQIPEDFLRLAIEHATKECGGQPTEGWVFSVPQNYEMDEVQNFRTLLQKAGCIGNIYIHGESDCVAYTSLPLIETIISKSKDKAFRQGQDFSVAVGVLDLGAGTTDITTSKICFKSNSTTPTINELKAPLGFAIGGELFEERFVSLARAKMRISMTPDEEQAFFKAFVDRFREGSKPRWPTTFETETYPFHVPGGAGAFELTVDEMTYIMDPPMDEICRRISNHLNGLTLDFVFVSGGNSEVPGMIPGLQAILKKDEIIRDEEQVIHLAGQTLNAVVHGLHYWINNPRLVQGRYARVTLALVAKCPISELKGRIRVDDKDVEIEGFYDCAERLMTEGVLVPDGIGYFKTYFDFDKGAKSLKMRPYQICIPNKDAKEHTKPGDNGPCTWNFASDCIPIGTVDVEPIFASMKIDELSESPFKGRRRLWLQLGFEIDIEIRVTVSWRPRGLQVRGNDDVCSKTMVLNNLELGNGALLNEFRAPIEKRKNSGSSISNDPLPSYLDTYSQDSCTPSDRTEFNNPSVLGKRKIAEGSNYDGQNSNDEPPISNSTALPYSSSLQSQSPVQESNLFLRTPDNCIDPKYLSEQYPHS